jgi:CheY-like chemotaxis protein
MNSLLPPALILLDMQPPAMSGLDVLADFRQDRRTAAVAVMELSSACREDGWTEPIDFAAVVAALVSRLPAPGSTSRHGD